MAADHVQGASLLTEHLVSLGHRRIGFVRRPEVYETDADRHEGYCRGLREAGIAYDPSLVVNSDSANSDDVERTFRAFLQLPQPPTGIIFFTDPMAMSAMKLARDWGIRVPADLSVTGYDGILSSSGTNPALTTVRQPMGEMGRLAIETVLRQIAGGSAQPRQITLPVSLVARDSSGPRGPLNGVDAAMGHLAQPMRRP